MATVTVGTTPQSIALLFLRREQDATPRTEDGREALTVSVMFSVLIGAANVWSSSDVFRIHATIQTAKNWLTFQFPLQSAVLPQPNLSKFVSVVAELKSNRQSIPQGRFCLDTFKTLSHRDRSLRTNVFSIYRILMEGQPVLALNP